MGFFYVCKCSQPTYWLRTDGLETDISSLYHGLQWNACISIYSGSRMTAVTYRRKNKINNWPQRRKGWNGRQSQREIEKERNVSISITCWGHHGAAWGINDIVGTALPILAKCQHTEEGRGERERKSKLAFHSLATISQRVKSEQILIDEYVKRL